MTRVQLSILCLAVTAMPFGRAQSQGTPCTRKSPRKSAIAPVLVQTDSLILSWGAPAVGGRLIFDDARNHPLVPFDSLWRTGANEATTLRISHGTVTINHHQYLAGKYAIFTVPGAKTWRVYFSSDADAWGTAFDMTKVVDSLTVTPQPLKNSVETMNMAFTNGTIVLEWDKVRISFPFAQP